MPESGSGQDVRIISQHLKTLHSLQNLATLRNTLQNSAKLAKISKQMNSLASCQSAHKDIAGPTAAAKSTLDCNLEELAVPLFHIRIITVERVRLEARSRSLEHLAESIELVGVLRSEIAIKNPSRRCTRRRIVDGVANDVTVVVLGDVVRVLHMGFERTNVLQPRVGPSHMAVEIVEV